MVTVAAGRQLDAGLGPVNEVLFNLVGGPPGPPPPSSSFDVLPVRVFNDPTQSDPDANVAQVGDGWDVVFNFLLQYGATAGTPPTPNYTVEIDGDWGGAWNDGTPGRVYPLPGSPFNTPGPHTSVLHIAGLMQPAGTYTIAIRVTDGNGEQYTYVWPNPVVLAGVAPPRPEWFMFGHDPQHTRRSPYVGAQTNSVKWSYNAMAVLYSSPAIAADGTVYVGSSNNKLNAINPDGSLKWIYTTWGNVPSSPAIGWDGTVFVGSEDKWLYAINPDGSLKWTFGTGSLVQSSPSIGLDGTVYVGSWDGKLYAVNPDGSLKWAFSTTGTFYSSPAVGLDGTVYAGNWDDKLYAINPDGSLKWAYTTLNGIYSSPAIGADGAIFVGSDDNNIYALNPDGSLRWTYFTGTQIHSSPAIGADGVVYIGSRDYLHAINPDGSRRWRFATAGWVYSSPALGADGTAYVGCQDNNVYAINPDGSLKWSYTTGSSVESSPAIGADGTVYVGSYDGKLYAFGPSAPGRGDWWMFGHDPQHTHRSQYVGAQTNNVKWTYATGDWIWASPTIGVDGTVYIGSSDKKLHAINPDGSQQWAFSTPDGVGSSAAIGIDGTVYVGGGWNWIDNHLYAINPDGSLKWAFLTDSVFPSSPAIGIDGTVYAGCDDSKLYAINPDGSLKWAFTAASGIVSSPAIGTDGTIYVGSSWNPTGNKFYAINRDGSLKWSYPTEREVLSSPAVGADGTVYVGCNDGKLYAFNPDGSLQWAYDTGYAIWWSSPALGADGTVYVGGEDWMLHAINLDGSLKWNYPTGSTVYSSPAIDAEGTVYVGCDDSNIYAINADGSLKWAYARRGIDYAEGVVGAEVTSPAIGADGTVYIGSDNGKLYAFGSGGGGASGWIVSSPTPDSAGDVGRGTSLEIVNGNPAIAYYDATNANLKYVRALDADGLSWGAPAAVDTAGDVGRYCSLAVAYGRPAIAYYDGSNTRLMYVRALDASGSAWDAPQVLDGVAGEDSGKFCALSVINLRPSVVYSTETAGSSYLKFIYASDARGVNWEAPQSASSGWTAPCQYFSIAALRYGYMGIAWYSSQQGWLQYLAALPSNINGSGASNAVVDGGLPFDRGQCASLKPVAGLAAIAYRSATETDLRYIRATSDFAAEFLDPPMIVDKTTDVGLAVSMSVIGGLPAIAYYDEAAQNQDLLFVRALQATGGSWGAPQRVDDPGDVGQYCSLAEVNGQAGISYYDASNGVLKFARYYP